MMKPYKLFSIVLLLFFANAHAQEKNFLQTRRNGPAK